ncbi:putative polysaccharide biosynthesis protein [Furfurilactobacillus curtus]|uniref:Polysaccharide biosynthesis protein n=1 Tax=Furfurilactobacillus curtus TaxID=1746200 RepID=A0ABQ5JKD4_9LACO
MSKKDPTPTEDQPLPTRKQFRRRRTLNSLMGLFHLRTSAGQSTADEGGRQSAVTNNEEKTSATQAQTTTSSLSPESASKPMASNTMSADQASVANEMLSEDVSASIAPATSMAETERPVPLEALVSASMNGLDDAKNSNARNVGSASESVEPKRQVVDKSVDQPFEESTVKPARMSSLPDEQLSATPIVQNAAEAEEDLAAIVEKPGFEAGAVSDQEQILRGTGWMTAASITSRILGALYIIPWVIWFGSFYNQANALFSKGYNVYSIVLMISTAGIPAAISKLIAHYNALNEYGIGFRLFKRGMLLSLITGIIAAVILWVAAPLNLLTTGDPNVIPVLRSLTLAVFVFPILSMMRGMFQGYHMMAPSAVSQFIEQLIRIIYMLLTAYLIMEMGHAPAQNWPRAVVQSTFAAGLGAIGGIGVLVYQMWRYRGYFRTKIASSHDGLIISTPQLLKQIVWQAIPFTIVPSAIAIYQLFDQMTFFKIMHLTSNLSYSMQNTLYAFFDFNANKIIMITVSLASALAATAIPILTEAHTLKDQSGTSNQINFTLQLFSFIMIPSALGMAAISVPLYTFFYRYSLPGSIVLEFSAYLSILFGLFTVLSTIMQGVDQNRAVIWYLVIGLAVKMLLQFPLVALAEALGPLLATAIGFGVSCWLILRNLDRHFNLDWEGLWHRLNQIIVYALATFIVARLTVWGLDHVLNTQFKSLAFIEVLLATMLGGGVYVYLALRSHLADAMLGERAANLRQRLHIK